MLEDMVNRIFIKLWIRYIDVICLPILETSEIRLDIIESGIYL